LGRIIEDQKIILDVGLYKAKARRHGVFFDEYHIPQVTDIEFGVVKQFQ
jgi:hypothetical protein